MHAGTREDLDLQIKMMQYVIRDEDTDEIIGLDPDAPEDVKAAYDKMIEEMNSEIPMPK